MTATERNVSCKPAPKAEFICYFLLATIAGLAQAGILDFVPHLIADTILIIVLATLQTHDTFSKEGAKAANVERMGADDAMKFPFMASAGLFGLYVTFKYTPEQYIQLLISLYFVAAGLFVIAEMMYNFLELILPKDALKTNLFWVKYPSMTVMGYEFGGIPSIAFADPGAEVENSSIDILYIISLIAASPAGYFYWLTKHWMLNNLIGIGISLTAIKLIRPGSFKIVIMLLVGLFFYDIFWVFGTEVMVTVAKKFDGPIKLLFPRVDRDTPSLLGIGDIVIPAFLVSMMARFDYYLDKKRNPSLQSHGILSGRYFWVTLVGYFIGMVATMVSMLYFEAAQPALLYLVPSCLMFVLGYALCENEFTELWNYSEEEEPSKTPAKED